MKNLNEQISRMKSLMNINENANDIQSKLTAIFDEESNTITNYNYEWLGYDSGEDLLDAIRWGEMGAKAAIERIEMYLAKRLGVNDDDVSVTLYYGDIQGSVSVFNSLGEPATEDFEFKIDFDSEDTTMEEPGDSTYTGHLKFKPNQYKW